MDEGFYAACYLRAWALETHWRAALEERFGERWFASPEAGEWLRGLWRHGQRLNADELLADLDTIEWSDDLLLAQRYLPSDGFDLKLYVCGRSVFAVYKPTPFNGDLAAAPRPVEATPAMVDLALRCGATFGLEIYGVDTIETPDGLAVIEVNEFPNFTGVPHAGECIADYVLSRARAARVQKGAARATAPTAYRVSAAAFAH